MSPRLITMKDVLQRIPLSKATVYRMISQGGFPVPVRVSKQRIAFVEGEVDAWIASRTRKHMEFPDVRPQ